MKRISAFLIVACLLISVTPLNVSADETKDIPANAQETGDHDSLVAALAKAESFSYAKSMESKGGGGEGEER